MCISKNLKETVFFFPELKTDSEGNIILTFKMNEALTKWRLMSFAHTLDFMTGYDESRSDTKKSDGFSQCAKIYTRRRHAVIYSKSIQFV
ncbi:MAG: hypothetical protein IPL55_06425 [Saprospiraceae bacterium]|nr:hypothetical protein [Saprospiraceae bacterium]